MRSCAFIIRDFCQTFFVEFNIRRFNHINVYIIITFPGILPRQQLKTKIFFINVPILIK